jgi:hypothetical protein
MVYRGEVIWMSGFKINFELPSEFFQDESLKKIDEYCINQLNENNFHCEKDYNLALINEFKNASINYLATYADPSIPVNFTNYRSESFDKSEYMIYLNNKEK